MILWGLPAGSEHIRHTQALVFIHLDLGFLYLDLPFSLKPPQTGTPIHPSKPTQRTLCYEVGQWSQCGEISSYKSPQMNLPHS